MLEALICLPVLVGALGGIVALHAAYGAKLEAMARARRIAWLQADSGECPARSCSSGECGSVEGDIRSGGLDAVLAARRSPFSLDSFLGDLGRFLAGTVTRGVGVASARTSTVIGKSVTSQQGVTTLMCNTTSRHTDGLGNVLREACATGLASMEYASAVCR